MPRVGLMTRLATRALISIRLRGLGFWRVRMCAARYAQGVTWVAVACPGHPRRCQGYTLGVQLSAACVSRLLGLVGWALWAWTVGSGFVGPRM
jgi:hypothetical protein